MTQKHRSERMDDLVVPRQVFERSEAVEHAVADGDGAAGHVQAAPRGEQPQRRHAEADAPVHPRDDHDEQQ